MNPSHTDTEGVAENHEDAAADPVLEDSAEVSDEPSAAELLRAECDRLSTERNELKDLLQRNRAEFDNFRRRVEREKMELAEYGTTELMRTVVALLDDFDRAISVDSTDKVYSKGIELIHSRFMETLKKQG